MKITVEHDGKEPIVYEDVQGFLYFGQTPTGEFHDFSGLYPYLIGQLSYFKEAVTQDMLIKTLNGGKNANT